MNRPPRNPKKPLFNKRVLALSLLQGLSVLGILLVVFNIALFRGRGAMEARTLTFTTLIVANLALILTNRSWSRTIWANFRSPNAALGWVIAGAVIFLGLVLYLPFFRKLFHFNTLHPDDLMLCLFAGIFSILWFEGLKILRMRPRPNSG